MQLQVRKTDEGRSPTSDWRAKLMLDRADHGRACRRTLKGVSVAPAKAYARGIVAARKHMIDGKLEAKDIAKMYGVSERSLWRNSGGLRS